MSLLQGIISAQNNQFEDAISKFKESGKNREMLADPELYCGLTRIC
jgi:hypothetical protein